MIMFRLGYFQHNYIYIKKSTLYRFPVETAVKEFSVSPGLASLGRLDSLFSSKIKLPSHKAKEKTDVKEISAGQEKLVTF